MNKDEESIKQSWAAQSMIALDKECEKQREGVMSKSQAEVAQKFLDIIKEFPDAYPAAMRKLRK